MGSRAACPTFQPIFSIILAASVMPLGSTSGAAAALPPPLLGPLEKPEGRPEILCSMQMELQRKPHDSHTLVRAATRQAGHGSSWHTWLAAHSPHPR